MSFCPLPLRRLTLCALGLLTAVPALRAAVPNRISGLSDSSRSTLAHSVPARAKRAADLGQAPLTLNLPSVTLHFNLSAAQQTALNQLSIDQQNPSSPRYHQWLTPVQYGAQFGLSSSDLARVQSWLTGQGLKVVAVSPSSNFITVSGTVAQVQTALGTSIHSLTLDGKQHFSNISDPALPSALLTVVQGVTGLNDFKLKPRSRTSTVPAPKFTSSISGNHFIAPGDFYTIYDETPLLSSAINGTGVTVAIMGQTDISLSDDAAFRSAAGLTANAPTVRLFGSDPGTSTDDIDEAMLDVEWSGATAPSASILYVNSTDVINTSLINAITSNVAPILSVSYGLCEAEWGQSSLVTLNQYFEQANVQGQTIVGPAGDSGATDCDYDSTTAADGLAVDFPASSPFVTGAGGTMFNEGTGSYWGTTNGTYQGSALSYIPEEVWNETSATYGLAAGGGGVSTFFSKPAWQVGTGVPSDLSRDVPDIALGAAASHDGFLYCVQGSCVNGFRAADSTLSVVGGTSVAAPSFAGVLALVEQKTGSRLGNANPQIYGLANSTYYNNVFHDITVGNNSSSCVQGSPNCPNGGSIGYSAAAGYDLATGWGTIDAFNLVNHWGTVASTGTGSTTGSAITTTVVSTSAATCGISGGSLPLSIAVSSAATGTTATPTGTVQFLVDNAAVGSPVAITNGAATYTLNTTSLTSGGHTVSAVYTGDSTFAGSKGSLLTDVVSSSLPDFSITPCVTPTVAVAAGASAAGITFSVNPFHGFTGPVTFTASSDASLTGSYSFSVTPVTISGATSATTVFTLSAYQTSSKTSTGLIKLGTGNGTTAGLGGGRSLYTAGSGVALASLLLLTLPRRRRWGALLAVGLSIGAIATNGCGGGATTIPSTGSSTVTTPASPGTYTVTIIGIGAGSSGSLVHSAQVTFQVH